MEYVSCDVAGAVAVHKTLRDKIVERKSGPMAREVEVSDDPLDVPMITAEGKGLCRRGTRYKFTISSDGIDELSGIVSIFFAVSLRRS